MAQLQLSDWSSVLKEITLPFVQDNFPKKTILLDKMKRNAGTDLINDEFIAPIYTSRHGGVANMANDSNDVVQGGGRNTSRGTVAVKIVTGALDISKLAIDASRTPQLGIENALTAQSKTLASDFARQVNRQLYSDGVGVVAQVRVTGGSVSTGVIAIENVEATIDDGRVLDTYGTINGDIAPNKYFAVDQIIGVGTGGLNDGTITSVTGTSITSGAPTAIVTNANDAIYIQDGSGEGAGTSEIVGIRAALSSSIGANTYAGVTRDTTGWAPQFGSASEALTMSRITGSYLSAKETAELDDQYVILVNQTLYQKYGDILTSMRRTVNEADLLGGWTGLEFAAGAGRVGVFLDYDVPDGEVLIINLDSWTITQVSDVNWLEDPNGGGLLRKQNTIKFQAVMVWFTNVFCLAPAANGRETRKTN